EERIIVEFDGPLAYSGSRLTPDIQMLAMPGAKLPKKLERSLDASGRQGPIKLVSSFREGNEAKVVVSTRGAAAARLEERPGALVWHFRRPAESRDGTTEAVSMAGTRVAGVATGVHAAMGPAQTPPA